MSQENLEDFIRGGYARFNRAEPSPAGERKLASLDSFYHPEAVYVNVRQQVGQWVIAYPDLQVEPLEIQTNGDRAFVWVRFSGHGAGSGAPLSMEIGHVVTVEADKVLRVEEYSERVEGLRAAGLPE